MEQQYEGYLFLMAMEAGSGIHRRLMDISGKYKSRIDITMGG